MEDVIIAIIDANPPDMNVFNGADGNFPFVGFQYAFAGQNPESVYNVAIDPLRKKYSVLVAAEKKTSCAAI